MTSSNPMRPPRLPHDDPELEPLAQDATPGETVARYVELARRLGSALAEMTHAIPAMREQLTAHTNALAHHDAQIRELQLAGDTSASIEALRATLVLIMKQLPGKK
jgi:hypothetical protein